uniref:Uncharacterized protein n=1 Tax=Amphimedon queenslandica TaxID=400682 RepID=A0A1X7TSP8_AMPQE
MQMQMHYQEWREALRARRRREECGVLTRKINLTIDLTRQLYCMCRHSRAVLCVNVKLCVNVCH